MGLLTALRSLLTDGSGPTTSPNAEVAEATRAAAAAFPPDSRPPSALSSGWTPAAEGALLAALNVRSFAAAQDVVNALLMSDIAYKMTEAGPAAALASLRAATASFPPGLVTVGPVQATRPHVAHSYVLGVAPGALLVAFAGTKAARDVVTDVDIRQTKVWLGGVEGCNPAAAVHRGFLARAQGVPVGLLASHAAAHGRRLVLCGHSLGGAVATMSALNLLRQQAEGGSDSSGGGRDSDRGLSCITFAAPAVGNAALAALVRARPGWHDIFYNLTFPDDAVPRLLASTPTVLATADAAAEAGRGGPAPVGTPPASISHEPFGGGGGEPAMEDGSAPSPSSPSSLSWASWAAAAVGEAAARAVPAGLPGAAWDVVVPSYAHFGQHHSPAVPEEGGGSGWSEEEEEEAVKAVAAAAAGTATATRTTPVASALQARVAALASALPTTVADLPDALTRVPGLAAHRVATYRDRVRALARGVAGAPRGWPAGAVQPPPPALSQGVAPPLVVTGARAKLPPLPPPPPPGEDEEGGSGGNPLSSYWSVVRRTAADLAARAGTRVMPGGVGGGGPTATAAAAAAALNLTVLVRGRGLASASGARVGLARPGAPPAWFPTAIRRRPPPGSTGPDKEEVLLAAVARMPVPSLRRAAAAVADAASASTPSPLHLLLRSDCAATRRSIALDPHTAWLVWARGRPQGGDSSGGDSPASGEFHHNGVRYVTFDGPAAALAGLRAADRGSGGGGWGWWGGRLRAWWTGGGGGGEEEAGPAWPDLVLALHGPDEAGGVVAAWRALGDRARLVPVCLLSLSPGSVGARTAVGRLFEGALPSHVLVGGSAGALTPASRLPPGLDGLVYRELLSAGGVARL